MRHININGRLIKDTSASVPYNNRAFRFGYGIFETMLMRESVIQLKEYHWQRLFDSIEKLGFEMPELMTREWIESEILKTVKKNKLEKLCRIRLQIYAGRGGLYDGQNMWSEFVIECVPIEQHLLQLNERGLITCIAVGLQKSPDTIANLKTSNALIYSLAAKQAKKNRVDDALVCNTHDNIIEGTIANIFWVKGDDIYTPPLSEGCVAGVMRKYLLEQMPMKGINIQEKVLTREELKEAEAVFMTNSIRRIKWISNIDGNEYKIDKVIPIYENIPY